MRRRLQHVLICGLWLAMLAVMAPAMPAAEARIAVAANFAGPMQRLVPLFESATGHRLIVAVGAPRGGGRKAGGTPVTCHR